MHSRSIDALKKPSGRYDETHRFHITAMFTAMRMTHKASGRSSRKADPPEAIDALVLARSSLEALYVICLMLEDAEYVTSYCRWLAKTYVRILLQNEECRIFRDSPSLPKVTGMANDACRLLRHH